MKILLYAIPPPNVFLFSDSFLIIVFLGACLNRTCVQLDQLPPHQTPNHLYRDFSHTQPRDYITKIKSTPNFNLFLKFT